MEWAKSILRQRRDRALNNSNSGSSGDGKYFLQKLVENLTRLNNYALLGKYNLLLLF